MIRAAAVAAILVAAACAGCRSQPSPPRTAQSPAGAPASQAIGWRKLGSWSGQGDLQTPSFESATGQLRVRWRASAPAGSSGGSFQLSARSAISGRVLQVAVEPTGPGEGTAYISQDPHDMYMEVESVRLDWAFTVEEAVAGAIQAVPSDRGR
jgi:hypothetical protein